MRHVAGVAVIVLLLLLSTRPADASSITLAWDPSPSSSAIGYVVHIGTGPGIYTMAVDVGNQLSFIFPDAVDGQIYHFAVNAYADGEVHGPLSNDISGYSNAPPQITSPGSQSNIVGDDVVLQLEAGDPDGDAVTFAATNLPTGLTIMPSTGLIVGTATTAGSWMVTGMASDGVLTNTTSFSWTVGEGTSADTLAPTIAIGSPASSDYNTRKPWLVVSGTADDDTGVTSVTWRTDNGKSGTASGTTAWSAYVSLQVGVNVLTVTARDAAGNTGTTTLTITRGKP